MSKKLFLTIISAIVFILALTTVSFAKNDNTATTKLGNEVTSSINKTERNMDDLGDEKGKDKAREDIKNGARDLGNTITDGMDDMGRTVEDLVGGDDDTDSMRNDDERTENRAVAGTTGNYTAGEVQTDGTTGRNGMTGNAWIWIVMVVVALIIVAAVWFYAAQK